MRSIGRGNRHLPQGRVGLIEPIQRGRGAGCGFTAEHRDLLLLNLYCEEELTYTEIGEVLEVTRSRVCQLHGRAIARLRVDDLLVVATDQVRQR